MRRSTFIATVSAVALLCAAGQAIAQMRPVLVVGASVEADLMPGEADAEYLSRDYGFDATAGQRLEFAMSSADFDAYLEIFADDGAGEALASDDDGAEQGTDSRLRFTAPETGAYILRARNLSGSDGGGYVVSMTERPPAPPAPRPGSIRLGQTVEGVLGAQDPETDEGARYDAWRFRARDGERVAMGLDSEVFDPVVRVGRMSGDAFEELAQNDDSDGGTGGLNSWLVFTAPTAGDYVIRVTPLDPTGEGAYSLRLVEGPEPASAETLTIGATVEGELVEGDAINENDQRADAYRFSGRAGQRIRADMTSEAFDTFLQLYHDNRGTRDSLAEDDDGGPEGTNSRLTYTLTEDGDYVLEARSFSTDGLGSYSLSLSESAPERPAAQLPFGAVVQGEITDEDAKDDDDRGYDAYSFSGVEDQRVQVIMRSGDFDTYLRAGSAEGDFSELASDDDGLGEGTDSRLNFTLPADGTYVLRASPLGSDDDGLYSIELIDRGPKPRPGSILIGAVSRGTLSESDATTDSGTYFDAYVFHAKEDEKLVITMVSNEVDSVVTVGRNQDDGAFEVLASDDDSLSDTHAKLEWTAPADGAYVIQAGAFAQTQTGAYALRVERQP